MNNIIASGLSLPSSTTSVSRIEALARRGLLPEVSPKPCASTLSFGLVLLEYFLLEKRCLLSAYLFCLLDDLILPRKKANRDIAARTRAGPGSGPAQAGPRPSATAVSSPGPLCGEMLFRKCPSTIVCFSENHLELKICKIKLTLKKYILQLF